MSGRTEGGWADADLRDVVDAAAFQALLEDFYRLTQIPVGLLDQRGSTLAGAGWQTACTEYHRLHPEARLLCEESEAGICARAAAGEFRLTRCGNGMWEVATPITIGQQPAGFIVCGQFFLEDEPFDAAFFRAQALRYGFPEEDYLKALDKAPRISRATLDAGMAFLVKLGNMLSLLGYSNLKLARSAAERESLMRSLEASGERLKRAEGIGHLGSWELDLTTNTLIWSDEVYRIFGFEPREFAPSYERFLEAVHPDDRAAVHEAYSASLREGRDSYEIAHRVALGGTGEIRWLHEKCEHFRDDSGKVLRSVGMVQDITERRRAAEAIERSEMLYRTIARSLPETLVAVFDRDLHCLLAEGGTSARVRFVSKEAEGKHLREVIADPAIDSIEERLRRAFAGEQFAAERESGGRAYWSQYVPLRDERGDVFAAMVVSHDITERKRVEEQMRHAQKLESVGLLAGGIAHDFNNLLVGVVGNASLAAEMTPEGPVAEALRQIIRSGEQAAHLTRQLLAYAGKGRRTAAPVNMADVVRDGVVLIQSSISKRILLDLRLDPKTPAVESDAGQMQQIFMNLVLNAGEAIGDADGAITVSTGEAVLDAACIEADLGGWPAQPGRYARLEVQDTGSGMDAAIRERIFDPFFSTKFQGRGLGLAAVAGLVRSHGGAVQVITAPGRGSTFRVLLPAMAADAGPLEAPRREDLSGSATVLVVDDEPLVADLARRSLEKQGYEALVANTGESALEILQREAGRIRVVVLDIGVPGAGGGRTLSFLTQAWPQMRVIVSSGYSRQDLMEMYPGAAIGAFLQKPYTIQELAREVKAALAAGSAGVPFAAG